MMLGARRRLRRLRMEGLRVGPGARRRAKASLAKSLLDYFNDPTVPTSGDELTFFMTKEIMNRLAPSLLVVNFWDIDIAHYGAYSLYLEAIRRTDRLVHELWQHVAVAAGVPRSHDAASSCPSWAATATWPATASRTTAAATSPAVGCGSWRLARACRRAPAPSDPIRTRTSRRPWRGFSASRCRSARAGRSRSWPSSHAVRTQFDAGLGDAGSARASPPAISRACPRRSWPSSPGTSEVAGALRPGAAISAGAPGAALGPPGTGAVAVPWPASRGSRPRPAATNRAGQSRPLPGRGTGAPAEAEAPAGVAEGDRRPLPTVDPIARGTPLSRRTLPVASSSRSIRQRHRRSSRTSCGSASRAPAFGFP